MTHLRPVKRNQAHSQTMDVAKHLVDGDVVGNNPADPREVTEGLEKVPGEEIPDSRSNKSVAEEPLATYSSAVTDTGIRLRMKGVEKSAGYEIIWPDCLLVNKVREKASRGLTHGRWLHKESSGNTTDRESNELCRHHHHPLVYRYR